MAQLTKLPAEARTLGGKSALRGLRREGKVPGVMYGRETESTPIALDSKAFDQFMKRHGATGIVELEVGGDRGAAMIKEVQRHPVTGRVLHLDFQRISMQDRITSAVPVVLIGDTSAVTAEGGMISQQISELTVTCRADQLPEQIQIDVSGLTIGHALHVSDLNLPEGVETAQAADAVVVNASITAAARGQEAAEAEAGEAAPAAGEAAPAAEEGGE
jgi:large subunit ribosomal protein L25